MTRQRGMADSPALFAHCHQGCLDLRHSSVVVEQSISPRSNRHGMDRAARGRPQARRRDLFVSFGLHALRGSSPDIRRPAARRRCGAAMYRALGRQPMPDHSTICGLPPRRGALERSQCDIRCASDSAKAISATIGFSVFEIRQQVSDVIAPSAAFIPVVRLVAVQPPQPAGCSPQSGRNSPHHRHHRADEQQRFRAPHRRRIRAKHGIGDRVARRCSPLMTLRPGTLAAGFGQREHGPPSVNEFLRGIVRVRPARQRAQAVAAWLMAKVNAPSNKTRRTGAADRTDVVCATAYHSPPIHAGAPSVWSRFSPGCCWS